MDPANKDTFSNYLEDLFSQTYLGDMNSSHNNFYHCLGTLVVFVFLTILWYFFADIVHAPCTWYRVLQWYIFGTTVLYYGTMEHVQKYSQTYVLHYMFMNHNYNNMYMVISAVHFYPSRYPPRVNAQYFGQYHYASYIHSEY